MEEDYINWNEEREGVIDDTLDQLRDQRDREQNLLLSGEIQFNEYSFNTGLYLTIGPVIFDSSFKSAPGISLAQVIPTDAYGMNLTSSNDGPFMVRPYVHSWHSSSGQVDGFILGLYALTKPSRSVMHTISWIASGEGSVYMEQNTNESWEESYDNESSDFLVEDPEETFDVGDEFE